MKTKIITFNYDGKLSKAKTSDLINELSNRYPFVSVTDSKGNYYQVETKKGGAV